MKKLEKLLNENNLTVELISNYSGEETRKRTINKALNSMDLNNLSVTTIGVISRSLGLTLDQFLNDYDLDGTSGLVTNIKRIVNKVINRINKLTTTQIKQNYMLLQVGKEQVNYKDSDIQERLEKLKRSLSNDKGFILGIYLDKLENLNSTLNNPIDYLKTNYYFINPDLNHSEQNLFNIPQGNIEYWNNNLSDGKWIRKGININSQPNKIIGSCPALIMYTPLEFNGVNIGGDLKIILSVPETATQIKFSEIYGVEWLDKESNKEVCFYKAHFLEAFNISNIETVSKSPISEVEFYRGALSQFRKFKISK